MEKEIKLFPFMVNQPEVTKTRETIKATYGDYTGVLYGVSSMAIYDKDGHDSQLPVSRQIKAVEFIMFGNSHSSEHNDRQLS